MSYSYRSTKSSSVANRFARTRTGQRKSPRGPKGQYIDPSRFVKVATAAAAEAYEPTYRFNDFAINDLLKRNLVAKGYETPSPIQDQAIPPALNGQDVIGIAGTGTGKTAAFALPVLNQLMASQHGSALIVAPTRELAQQIEQEVRELSKGSNLKSTVLIGGTGMGAQLRDLRTKPRIIIGTPGRIKDHLERRTLHLGHCKFVVLDEVDRMLDMGFVHDVRHILSLTNAQKQSFFFSATMDPRVRGLIETFAKDPVTISIKPSTTSDNIHQNVVRYAGNSEKLEKLHELLIGNEVSKVIVFDETQRSVERLGKELITRGFAAESIHGGKSQGQRQRALKKFKQNEVTILVATDVAARGIDVADVTHVINFSIPKAYDDYIHRIGRAGRAGRVGYALTFVAR
jgi:superfamily II DNA/RNA helicase